MTLRNKFESSGNWLFRWRSYLPVILIVVFLLALQEYEYLWQSEQWDHIWEIICLIVSFLGLGIRIFTIGHTPKGTSGRNTKSQIAKTLNTTGLYSVVRNPLYLGNFFIGLGIALFSHLWWLSLIYSLSFWLYYERIIFAEEAFLTYEFGQEYLDWCKKTPVFIPNFKQYRKAALPFSVKNVLKREYNGFFVIIVVMFLLEVVGDFYYQHLIEIDTGWALLVTFSFVIWFTLRYLKKYTTLLHVEGR